MANKLAVFLLLIFIYNSCSTPRNDGELAHFVGDIYADAEQDDLTVYVMRRPGGVLFNTNFSRGMQIKGEKKSP
ncbi:MAG: hypothetical protein IPK46_13520 [Saprospiraceae bacterium]|nr:hypothetical protein [Saprospiraceae bacterium]